MRETEMKIHLLQNKKNKLLRREELELEVTESKSTPSRKELLERIAETAGSKPELIVIQRIEQQFGTHTNRVSARAYENREALEKTELKHLVGRDKGEKKKPSKKKKKEPEKK
jgi:small subunit ribosomal protein S24e